jgi:hypothetical protein
MLPVALIAMRDREPPMLELPRLLALLASKFRVS